MRNHALSNDSHTYQGANTMTDELPLPLAYYWTPKPDSGIPYDLKSWSTTIGPHPAWHVQGYYSPEEVRAIKNAAVLEEREKTAAAMIACGLGDHIVRIAADIRKGN
jgi:hypothetical protein